MLENNTEVSVACLSPHGHLNNGQQEEKSSVFNQLILSVSQVIWEILKCEGQKRKQKDEKWQNHSDNSSTSS